MERLQASESLMNFDSDQEIAIGLIAICQSLVRVGSELQAYFLYCSNFARAHFQLERLREMYPDLAEFIDVQELCEGLTLSSLLSLPVLRICQYKLWIEEVSKCFQSPEITQAKEFMNGFIVDLNDLYYSIDSRMRVAAIQEALFRGSINLVAPNRYLIRQGSLIREKKSTSIFNLTPSKNVVLFLFNDILILAESGDAFKCKQVLAMKDVEIEDIPDTEKRRYAFMVSVPTLEKGGIILKASEYVIKMSWLQDLRTCADKASKISTSLESSDLEFLVMKAKKTRPKLPEGWFEVPTDMNVPYYFQEKTGFTSLGLEVIDYTNPFTEKEGLEEGRMSSSMQRTSQISTGFKMCETLKCDQRALGLEVGKNLCIDHTILETVEKLTPLERQKMFQKKSSQDSKASVETSKSEDSKGDPGLIRPKVRIRSVPELKVLAASQPPQAIRSLRPSDVSEPDADPSQDGDSGSCDDREEEIITHRLSIALTRSVLDTGKIKKGKMEKLKYDFFPRVIEDPIDEDETSP
jgi:hypothetical protein